MKLSNIGLIIGREYSTRVKKKSFILLTILTPLLMAALMVVPVMISLYKGGDRQVISIVDGTGLLENYFESDSHTEYRFLPVETTQESLKQSFATYESSTVLYVSPLDSAGNASVTAYSKEPLGMEAKSDVEKAVSTALRDRKLKNLDIDNFDQIMDQVRSDVKIDAYTLDNSGKEKKDSVEMYMIIAYVLSFLIYMFVFLFGSMVMRGVIEETQKAIFSMAPKRPKASAEKSSFSDGSYDTITSGQWTIGAVKNFRVWLPRASVSPSLTASVRPSSAIPSKNWGSIFSAAAVATSVSEG